MTSLGDKTTAIVGFGQFGRFAATHLRDHTDLVVADRRDIGPAAGDLGLHVVSIEQAAGTDVVVLAVPVQQIAATARRIAPHLRAGALVVDVCSVKLLPLRWLREALPVEVEILGTHPMFGPNSAGGGLAGQRIVLCPERTARLDPARAFLEQLGLRVIVTDADTHDRQCAYTQAVAQYLGRALDGLDGTDFEIRTPASALLREVWKTVADDSFELFTAIQTLNPYAGPVRREIRERLQRIEDRMPVDGPR